jgi:hypothetical protein
MARVCYKESGLGDMGRYMAQNHYNHDYDASDSTKGGEWGMLFQFVSYQLNHFLLRQLRPFPVTA